MATNTFPSFAFIFFSCGNCICAKCSTRRIVIQGDTKPVRVCDNCYVIVDNGIQSQYSEDEEKDSIIDEPEIVHINNTRRTQSATTAPLKTKNDNNSCNNTDHSSTVTSDKND